MSTKMIHASGKRKSAIARATLKPGKGKVRINNNLLESMTPKMVMLRIMEPIEIAGDIANEVDIDVIVRGGGQMGQAEAARLVVAKTLLQYSKDKTLEQKYIAYDRHLLVADTRRKEASKPNRHGQARAKRQKSYR